MKLKFKEMYDYKTNCYILSTDSKDFIIDPGRDSASWVKENVKNPVGIFLTHGHYDHIWCACELRKALNVKIYIPKDDAFMLGSDVFEMGYKTCEADVLVEHDEEFDFSGTKLKFHFFPGHTPGCSAIELEDLLFSGDFVFNGAVGRSDFTYSNKKDMRKSIEKILKWNKEIHIYPGHGSATTLEAQRENLEFFYSDI